MLLRLSPVPEATAEIRTPLIAKAGENALQHHSDTSFKSYIVTVITNGFRIGFNRSQHLRSSPKNMPSALDNSDIVGKEIFSRSYRGPVASRVSPPRPNQSLWGYSLLQPAWEWHLIVNLSAPANFSVNDGIDKKLTSSKWMTSSERDRQPVKAGPPGELGWYGKRTRHPSCLAVFPSSGYEMEGSAIHQPDTQLVFRFAPKILNSVADALEWIAKARGAEFTYHYLDDFLVIGAPSSNACSCSLEILLQACSDLGVPVASHKCTSPTTCLIFLGIVIDAVKMDIRPPEEKLKQLKRGFFLEGKVGLHREGTRVSAWTPSTCCKSGTPR